MTYLQGSPSYLCSATVKDGILIILVSSNKIKPFDGLITFYQPPQSFKMQLINLHPSCLHNLCKNDRYLICQLNLPSINAVDLFPHITKIELSIQSAANYFYSIKQQTLDSPLLLSFFVYYFSTLDINTTVSTWYVWGNMSTG